MNAKAALFNLIVWGSSVGLLNGQIRSDFVLVPEGFIAHLVLDMEGRLHATWGGQGIHYGLFDSLGNPIREKKTFSENNLTRAPRLAISENHGVIAWTSFIPSVFSGVDGLLFRHDSGNVIGAIYYSLLGSPIGNPDVRYLNDSTFITVWDGEGPLTPFQSTGIYGLMLTNSLRAAGDTLLFSDDLPGQSLHSNARIAKSRKQEGGIVVWVALDPILGWNVFGRRLTKEGTLQNSAFLIPENQSNYTRAWGLSAVMDLDESFTVAWSAQAGDSSWNVYRRRFDANGLPIAPSEKISENAVARFAEVDIAMDLDGTHVVVWDGLRNNMLKIIAQRFAANGALVGANFLISGQADTVTQFVPSVVLNNSKIFTTWTVPDTILRRGTIWANILDFSNPIVSVKNQPENPIRSFYLHQNYPNPYNPATTIRYEIPHSSHIRLVIYNVLGEEIVTLINKEMTPGSYSQEWDGKDANGRDVPSGVYLYRLAIGGYNQTRKMLLVR